MDRGEIVELMAKRQLFEDASSDVLGELVDAGEVINVGEGDTMIAQGKIGETVWVLLEGSVEIIVDNEFSHSLDTAGTLLGEISAVSHTAATATVRAGGNVQALRIGHKNFHAALASSEKLASAVLRSLSKYL